MKTKKKTQRNRIKAMPSLNLIAILEISKLSEELEQRMLPFINQEKETVDFDGILNGPYIGAGQTCAILWARAIWLGDFSDRYSPIPLSPAMGIEIGQGVLRALATTWGVAPLPDWANMCS